MYKAVLRQGYRLPTPIQRKTIPIIMQGADCVAMARTGSGKTASFVIPMVQKLKQHETKVRDWFCGRRECVSVCLCDRMGAGSGYRRARRPLMCRCARLRRWEPERCCWRPRAIWRCKRTRWSWISPSSPIYAPACWWAVRA